MMGNQIQQAGQRCLIAKIARQVALGASAIAWQTLAIAADTSGWSALAQAAHDAVAAEFAQSFAQSSDRIEIELPTADPRKRIPVCSLPLQTGIGRHNGQGGRLSVRVECNDSTPWARQVAVQVKVFRQVVVTTRNMVRGELLTASDLTMQEVDISQTRGLLMNELSAARGLALKRNTRSGTPLSTDMVNAPLMVRRGDTVILTAERAGVSIRQQGTALQDGEAGRQIQVRNTRSNRVVQAVVTGHGEASVIF